MQMHVHHYNITIGQHRHLQEQLKMMGPRLPPQAMQPHILAEQQLRIKVNFHMGEGNRIFLQRQNLMEQRERLIAEREKHLADVTAGVSTANAAEVRALQLQSGQMYAVIKALSLQIGELGAEKSTSTFVQAHINISF